MYQDNDCQLLFSFAVKLGKNTTELISKVALVVEDEGGAYRSYLSNKTFILNDYFLVPLPNNHQILERCELSARSLIKLMISMGW